MLVGDFVEDYEVMVPARDALSDDFPLPEGVLNRPGFRGGSVTWNRPLLGRVFQGSARA